MWRRSLATRTAGLGDVSLARSAVRGINASDLTRAVHAALEGGLQLVDVSPDEDSERLVGEAIRSLRLRERVIAITRVPAIAQVGGEATRDALDARLPLRYLNDRIDRSLRATRLDALPLVAIELRAAWRTSKRWPEFVDTCARLVRDGKVREYAAYIENVEDDTADLLGETWLSALSVPYSLCERAADPLIATVREAAAKAAADAKTADATAAADAKGGTATAGSSASGAAGPRGTGAAPPAALPDDLQLAAAAARDPHLAAALAASMSGDAPLIGGGLFATSGSSSSRGGNPHASVDPMLAVNDPVVAAALARDPALAAALGIILPKPAAHDVAIFARRPLAGGALAGTLGPGVKLRRGDDRVIDAATMERVAVEIAKLSRFTKETPPAARSCEAAKLQLERNVRPEHIECATVAELALRFVLDRGAIPMVRLHKPEHIVDILGAVIAPPLSAQAQLEQV